MNTATYQFNPLEVLPYAQLSYEECLAEDRDLVQEAIDLVTNKDNMHIATTQHVLALLLLLKKGGMLA